MEVIIIELFFFWGQTISNVNNTLEIIQLGMFLSAQFYYILFYLLGFIFITLAIGFMTLYSPKHLLRSKYRTTQKIGPTRLETKAFR